MGRRRLALRSMFACTLLLGLLAASFMLPESTLKDGACLLTLLLYLVCYGAGMSTVPLVVNAEIYPLQVRSAALGQVSFVNWMLSYLVAQTALDLCTVAGDAGAFATYCALSSICLLGLYRYLPETCGTPLELMEGLFEDPYPANIHANIHAVGRTLYGASPLRATNEASNLLHQAAA